MTVEGLVIESWVALWLRSHAVHEGGTTLLAWPDGRSLIEQPAIVVSMFALIEDEVRKEIQSQWQAKTTS